MGSLSNLYISQSYQSLIHLGTDNSASATLIQLQDGLGNNLGVALNTQGDISASGDLTTNTLRIELDTEITGGVDINTFFTASTIAYRNVTDPFYTDVVRVTGSYAAPGGIPPTINDVKVGWICNGINVTNGVVTAVSGSGTGDVWITIGGEFPQISQNYTFTGKVVTPVRITGSLEVTNDITASNMQLKNDLFVSGTLHSNRVVTTTISSSQIYSSGSNQFGDSVSDNQTIVGQTTISGSLTVEGPFKHTGPIEIIGDVEITGSLYVSTAISSSTIVGIGNVELYSQSVDSRLDFLEGPFSTSVDQRLDSLEFFSASEEQKNITLAAYTASVNTQLTELFSTASNHEDRIDGLQAYTSSLRTAFGVSGTDVTFNGNINVSGSISAYEIHTIIESASVIFSSGSNVLGDEVSDTQTLNGTVNVVNTLFVNGVEFTPFSQSVDLRLDQLEAFSQSVNLDFVTEAELAAATGALEVSIAKKLDSASFESYTASNDTKWNTIGSVTASLNSFTQSQESKDSTLATYTASIDSKFTTLGTYTGSIDTKFSTLATYTGSVDTKFTTIGTYTASNDTKWNTLQNVTSSLINATGSYATTGSNTFIGTNVFSGSVQGLVTNISVLSSTASIDCSLGNFFNLSLPTGSTYLTATNIRPGLTITVKVDTNTNRTVVVDSSKLKFQNGAPYINTGTATNDILTFVSFDTGSLYGVAANLFS
jgi:cytoskeletal protein CcmA (bactofilin family)